MKSIELILLLIFCSYPILAQNNIIEDIFSQYVFREDFNEKNDTFPTEQISTNQFAVFQEKKGEYFIGSDQSQHIVMIDWKNDLINFELKTDFKFGPEEQLINLFQTESPQEFGILMKYNPDTQQGLIFEINSFKKYRLTYIKKDTKNRYLTYSKDDGWIKSDNLIYNGKNEILIKTSDNKFDFYINGNFEFKINLNKKRINDLSYGRFGFILAPKTKTKIDYIYISTLEEYDGINKVLHLNQKESENLIIENQNLKKQKKIQETEKIKELNDVIKLLENQLKITNNIKDSLYIEMSEFEPFRELIYANKDLIYTLSKDLTNEIEKNRLLKEKNRTLVDSIQTLIKNQEIFRLEYLKILMEQEATDTIE